MTALLIYLRWATEMWQSDTNDAVIDLVARASSGTGVPSRKCGRGRRRAYPTLPVITSTAAHPAL